MNAAATPASPDEHGVDRSILVDSRMDKVAKHAQMQGQVRVQQVAGLRAPNPLLADESHNLRR